MKNAFKQIILKTAFNTNNPRDFKTRIKFTEEVIIHLGKCGMEQMKKYSKTKINSLQKKLKNSDIWEKGFKVFYKNGLISIDKGWKYWDEVDRYTPFQLEQYLTWLKSKKGKK